MYLKVRHIQVSYYQQLGYFKQCCCQTSEHLHPLDIKKVKVYNQAHHSSCSLLLWVLSVALAPLDFTPYT